MENRNVQDIQSQGHSSGGWVFAKTPGLYEHIVVFDFKSLYPSIIRTFKIDPLSRLKADIHPLNTPVNISFSRQMHVLPAYIATLLDKRDQAKKMGDPHLSQAIKILMNSFYGVMGTPGCRFYNPGLPRAITGTGQWIRLTKSPKDYIKLVPPHVKAALLLKDKGDNLRQIYYVMTLKGPIPIDLPHDDLELQSLYSKAIKAHCRRCTLVS